MLVTSENWHLQTTKLNQISYNLLTQQFLLPRGVPTYVRVCLNMLYVCERDREREENYILDTRCQSDGFQYWIRTSDIQ